MASMSKREAIYKAVMHTYDLMDLRPVERRMIDIVIDRTIESVVEVVKTRSEKRYAEPGKMALTLSAELNVVAAEIKQEFNKEAS